MPRAARNAAVLAAGGAVLAFLLFYATTVDARAPRVVSVALTHHLGSAESVALTNASVEVDFSEPVDRRSAQAAFAIEPAVDGSFAWGGSTMVFTPRDPLPLDSEFSVWIRPGVRDAAGNEMETASEPFRFTTVGPPRVVASQPADGAAVASDAVIVLTFSGLMDTPSVERALDVSPGFEYTLRWSGETLRIVPAQPLERGASYVLRVDAAAADIAGSRLAESFVLSFSVAGGALETSWIVPADGLAGAAPTTPIAVAFDRPIDAASLDGAVRIAPPVAGSLVVAEPEGAAALDGAPVQSVVQFQPSAPLPANTTFEVEISGVRGRDGVRLPEPLRWSFTTGVSSASLRNQVVFISERSGIANLWAMNPDGGNQRQLSAELSPVTHYAVSPDGTRFIVGDGVRLVEQEAAGSRRRVLTEATFVEFDATYSPDGSQIAFARADAESGVPLGLWVRDAGGAGVERLELADPASGTDAATPSAPSAPPATARQGVASARAPAPLLRAPRYAPDGRWLAFVEVGTAVVVLDLVDRGVLRVPLVATAPPSWSPDSERLVVAGASADERPGAAAGRLDPGAPVPPPDVLATPADAARLVMISPDPYRARHVAVTGNPTAPVFASHSRVVYLRQAGDDPGAPGAIWLAGPSGAAGREAAPGAELRAWSVAMTPDGGAVVFERARSRGGRDRDGIWVLDLLGGEPERKADDGTLPTWVP